MLASTNTSFPTSRSGSERIDVVRVVSIYDKIADATLTQEEFVASVNIAPLSLDKLLARCRVPASIDVLPQTLELGASPRSSFRLLTGNGFGKTGDAARTDGHLAYTLSENVLLMQRGHDAVRVGRSEIVDLEPGCFLKSLADTPLVLLELHFMSPGGSHLLEPTATTDIGGHTLAANDYCWDFEDRYVRTYGEGGDIWETAEPNQALELFLADYGAEFRKVIDLGTGEGRDAIYLSTRGYDVVGIDVSPTGLDKARARARERNLEITFLQRDVIFLRGFPANLFDAAISMGCLHLIDVQSQRNRHLRRVFDILRPGGLFLLGHCQQDWLKGFWSVVDYESAKHKKHGDLIPTRIRTKEGGELITQMPVLRHCVKTEDELSQEVTHSGFRIVRTYTRQRLADLGNLCVLVAQKPAATG